MFRTNPNKLVAATLGFGLLANVALSACSSDDQLDKSPTTTLAAPKPSSPTSNLVPRTANCVQHDKTVKFGESELVSRDPLRVGDAVLSIFFNRPDTLEVARGIVAKVDGANRTIQSGQPTIVDISQGNAAVEADNTTTMAQAEIEYIDDLTVVAHEIYCSLPATS